MHYRLRSALLSFTCLIPVILLAGHAPLGGAPTAAAATEPACGDGLFTVGETCEACPADCLPKACTTDGKTHRRYTMTLNWPTGPGPTDVTALVSYRSGALSVPGTANEESVQSRITPRVKPDVLFVRDSDYALAVTMGMTKGFSSGPTLDIDFDACAGGQTPSPDDVRCQIVGCVGVGGPLTGCSCEIATVTPVATSK